jgi:hypothetical protein
MMAGGRTGRRPREFGRASDGFTGRLECAGRCEATWPRKGRRRKLTGLAGYRKLTGPTGLTWHRKLTGLTWHWKLTGLTWLTWYRKLTRLTWLTWHWKLTRLTWLTWHWKLTGLAGHRKLTGGRVNGRYGRYRSNWSGLRPR